eukprot:537930-Pelagomonas_calceolata.AAC.1
MDACRNEKLLKQGIQVPQNISRAIPDWVFPAGTGSSTLGEALASLLVRGPFLNTHSWTWLA